ncbi:MAG: hypothetical protein IPG93_20840 [Burkholderiales bacterium]|nr:hypothetical protein [Burkholderiales bacterium]
MSASFSPTLHDVSPEVALAVVAEHQGPVLVDLDETLYLSNSTEDFIDSVAPRLPALLLLRLLELIRPWRWTGGEATRDIWRVRLICLLFPWTMQRWKVRVADLAARYRNTRLIDVLSASSARPVVATIGFVPIVTPLVAALGLPLAPIVAARLHTLADRRGGKLELTCTALGDGFVGESLVLTDSAQDLPLLEACALPLRVIWPLAQYRPALADVYLPGLYLTRVKRPGERYITRAIVQEDFALWVLASIGLATQPFSHILGLALLLLSFWTIYEVGYVDNDLIASRFEADPKLGAAFASAPVATPPWQPWIWAFATGAAGVLVLRWQTRVAPVDLLAWAGVLLATHGWFTLYNRFDKGTRVWLFAGLQFARSAAFVALVPISPIGAAALGAHVLAKWVPYYVYRLVGKAWPEAPFHLTRLLFFAVLAALLAFTSGVLSILTGSAAALLVWNLYRARQELATACAAARRLDHVVTEPQP